MQILVDYIKHNNPEKVAVRCGEVQLSYSQLNTLVEERAKQFAANKHKAVVFRCTQDEQFIINYLAIHRAQAVAVPLEKDIPDDRFDEISALLRDMEFPAHIADILFTTGTTGTQKGVMISHSAIVADGENLIQAQGFSAHTHFIICGPLNHIGCLSKLYPIIMQGASFTILPGMKDHNAFFEAIDEAQGRVATFLVPANIRMLLAFSRKRLAECAHKIDFIETGAAAIFKSDMQQLCDTLPSTRLYNTYASTETGIIATYDFQQGECVEGCLGKPMKNSSFHISNEGTIVCQGKTLMSGYVGNQELTSRVLHDDCLFTSDKGQIDTHGRLHLQGRADDVINTGGFKVNPLEVENVAMQLPAISDCVCVAAQHPVMGIVPKLLVVLAPHAEFSKRAIAKALAQQLESYKVPLIYEQVASIQRTYNGKINRRAYAEHRF